MDHRVKEINSLLPSATWKYCPTKENPADLGTRGKAPKELVESDLWWHGPDRLCTEHSPRPPLILSTEETRAEEVKSVMHVYPSANKTFGLSSIIDLQKFSEKERLLRVTAWILRFHMICKLKEKIQLRHLQVEDIVQAEKEWIKEVQRGIIRENDFENLENALSLFECEGIIRCKGRLENANLPVESVTPSLLPRDSRFTELVITDSHERIMHGWVNLTLAEVRQRF